MESSPLVALPRALHAESGIPDWGGAKRVEYRTRQFDATHLKQAAWV